MKNTLPFLISLTLAATAAAQSHTDGVADIAPVDSLLRYVDAVGVDAGFTMRPALVQRHPGIIVIGQPHAIVAVFIGIAAKPGDTDLAPVSVLLGGGRLDASGKLSVPIYWWDFEKTDGAPVLAQAMQLRPDGSVGTSPILTLRRPDGDADGDGKKDGVSKPVLKIQNDLNGMFEVQAELLATDSEPPQYHLHFAVEVPTTGYSLHVGALRRDADRTMLTIELMNPDPDMSHLTVLETLRAFVDLGSNPGAIELTVRRTPFADGTKGGDVLR